LAPLFNPLGLVFEKSLDALSEGSITTLQGLPLFLLPGFGARFVLVWRFLSCSKS
jgi:hypothetical protein